MIKIWIWIMINLARMTSKALLEECLALLVFMSLCVIETAALMEGQYTLNVFDGLQQLKWLAVLIILIVECTEMIIGREMDKALKIICFVCASVLFLAMEYSVRMFLFVSLAVLFINLVTFIFEKKVMSNKDEKEESSEKNK